MNAASRIGLLPLLLLSVLPSSAAIFMRVGRGTQALEQLGGVPLHQADVRINGQPGRLSVYGFEAAPDALAPDLRKALGMPELTGADAALVTHVENGQATSLLLLPGASSQSSVVMLIEQSAAARHQTLHNPPAWPAGLSCPGADLLFSAENEKTRTAFAVAATADAPQAALARMDSVLTGSGWTRVPPQTAGASLALYARGNRVFVASAAAAGNGQTRITLLQRLGTAP